MTGAHDGMLTDTLLTSSRPCTPMHPRGLQVRRSVYGTSRTDDGGMAGPGGWRTMTSTDLHQTSSSPITAH